MKFRAMAVAGLGAIAAAATFAGVSWSQQAESEHQMAPSLFAARCAGRTVLTIGSSSFLE